MRILFDNSMVPESEYRVSSEKLASYVKRLSAMVNKGLYKEPESSILLPGDGALWKRVESILYEKVPVLPKFVILAGIGGSSLGVRAVYEFISGAGKGGSELLVLEGNNPQIAERIFTRVENETNKPEDILFVIASKSGNTVETISNAEYATARLGKKFPDIKKRTIVISDENSPLFKGASFAGISVLHTPATINGRFSVFSSGGLVPLGALGFDIKELLEGALETRDECLSYEENNPATMSALFLYYWHKRGKNIHDIFLFNSDFEFLGKWYRQLLSESIGKSNEIGITPTVSIGPADLHATTQLLLAGPKDKTVSFVFEENTKRKPQVPFLKDRVFPDSETSVSGKTFSAITEAIYRSAKKSYSENEIPIVEIILKSGSAKDLGSFLQWKMMEVMYLAELFGVNAFNQPAVDAYKNDVRNILNEN